MRMLTRLCLCLPVLSVMGACSKMVEYDLLIRNGEIHDGSGGAPFRGDIAVNGDTIAAIGNLSTARGRMEVDAQGLAVAPGFINMMCWANESLIADGRSQSEIRQGVTLEVLGEGNSMGPLNEKMKVEEKERQGDIKYDIEWTTLREYLDFLVRRGVSCNVTSFVGAATVRIHEIGHEDRRPTPQELERMKALVRQAMEEGAVGLSSALIYAPGCYADTEELLELAKVAAEYDGLYVSHLRSESEQLLEALDELVSIARRAKIRAEVYHIKASGRRNWNKLDEMFRRIEAARAEGLHITADMYMYHASATGLDSIMPPWVQEGGHRAWVDRLKDPAIREKVKQEIRMTGNAYDNGMIAAGSADNIILIGFCNEALRPLTGMTLAEVAAQRGRSPEDTAIDLIIEDDSRVGAAFFTMSEDNVRKEIRQPWISFCSDSASQAPEGIFLKRNPHPRAYGSFARLLGKYVREEGLIPLPEAVRRLTSQPAENMRLDRRGRLTSGYFADVVIFDPAAVTDHATFKQPHQYATGVRDVFVNGVQVLKNGEHTGAKPGRVVCGPGARKR
ncbi:MAG: D-aminoacylase [Planctomycetes bacterium]|nr:D-aminoacylase [Planctomycetota bacterium]